MARRRRPMTAGIIRKAMKGGRATAVLLLLAAALAAGCGDDVKYAHAPGHRVVVRLAEYSITPQNTEVSAGRITLVAHNVGRLTHNPPAKALDAVTLTLGSPAVTRRQNKAQAAE